MIEIFILLAVLNIIICSRMFPGICRVDFKGVLKFVGIMALVSVARLIIFKFLPVPMPTGSDVVMNLNPLQLLMVFWEDAFFTLPALALARLGASKFDVGAVLAISAVAFASGHMAYGLVWALITLLYVPFISYKYGKTHGLGTVMICHILYDLITFFTLKLLLG